MCVSVRYRSVSGGLTVHTEQVDGAFSLIFDQFHLVERDLHCLVGESDCT